MDVAFTRKGKLSLSSVIKFPLCNHKKTTSLEINRFLRTKTKDRGVRISKQAVSEKRQFIDPQVYIWHEWWFSFEYLWSKLDEMPSFKGLHVMCNWFIDYWNTKYEINIEMILEYLKKLKHTKILL